MSVPDKCGARGMQLRAYTDVLAACLADPFPTPTRANVAHASGNTAARQQRDESIMSEPNERRLPDAPRRLSRAAHDHHALDGQRPLRPREQRRVLLVLRHRRERLPDRGERQRHPRPAGDRHRRGDELPLHERAELSGHGPRRARAREARQLERRLPHRAVPQRGVRRRPRSAGSCTSTWMRRAAARCRCRRRSARRSGADGWLRGLRRRCPSGHSPRGERPWSYDSRISFPFWIASAPLRTTSSTSPKFDDLGDEAVDLGLAAGELDREAVRGVPEHAAARALAWPTRASPTWVAFALSLISSSSRSKCSSRVTSSTSTTSTSFSSWLRDLVDDRLVAGRDQRQARDRGIVGRRHAQRLDVVAAGREQAGDAGQGARLVLQRDGDDVAHGSSRWTACGIAPPCDRNYMIQYGICGDARRVWPDAQE